MIASGSRQYWPGRPGRLGPCTQPGRRLRDVARNLADLELSDTTTTALVAGAS
jgi:hypothetical protein